MRMNLSASLVLSVALMLGRFTGLLRELELASLFGVSRTADLAILLLTLPDILVNLLVAGGISASLVPRFSTLVPAQAIVLFRQATVGVLVLFGVAGLVLVAWPQGFFYLIAPGIPAPFGPGEIMLVAVGLAIPLTGAAGISGAYLNANQRFMAAGSGTLFFNLIVLCALVFARGSAAPLLILAWGVLGGAVLRWAIQLVVLPRMAWFEKSVGLLIDKTLIKSFAIASTGSVLLLLAPLFVRSIASTIGSGAIASFNYAQKLIELPLTILITAIGTVALSKLSLLHAKNKVEEARDVVVRDTQYAMLVSGVLLLLGVWFSEAVVTVIFGRGKMDAAAIVRISDLTRIAFFGLPFAALSTMAAAKLNASHRVGLVLKSNFRALLLLPLLILPGLIGRSEQLLMLAVVGFQAIASLLLARAARLDLMGSGAVFCAATWPYFLATLGIALTAILVDVQIQTSNSWLKLALAGASFGLAMIFPIKQFLKSSVKPNLTSLPL